MAKKPKIPNILDAEQQMEQVLELLQIDVNADQYLQFSQKVAEKVCKKLLISTCYKIGALEGLKQANDILKYKLETPVELDYDDMQAAVEKIGDLEIQAIAISESHLSKETKQKLLDLAIEKSVEPSNGELKRSEALKQALYKAIRDEAARINNQLGERPSNNINEVRPIKPARKTSKFKRKKDA